MPISNPLPLGSHGIMINGIEQRYHVAGRGPLCIVHPGAGVDWAYLQMRSIESQHLTMLYIEPIGTGKSGRLAEHPEGYTVERYCQQLKGIIDTLDLSGFFLLGHAHGGFVIQQYAVAYPSRIAGLIIYSSSAVTGSEFMTDAARNIAGFVRRKAGSPEAKEVAQAWASNPSASGADQTQNLRLLLPAYFADHQALGAIFHELRSTLRASFLLGDDNPFDFRQALTDLRVPTLILAGEHDIMCGPKWAEILHGACANSQMVIFRHSGHMAHIEQPNEFAGVIGAFVFRHRPGRTSRPPFDGKSDEPRATTPQTGPRREEPEQS